MINDDAMCILCNNKNYVSVVYGKYIACDVCIRVLISTAVVLKVDKVAKELMESEEEWVG